MNARATALVYHDLIEGGRYSDSGFPGASANIYNLDAGEFREHLAAIEKRSRNVPTTCERMHDRGGGDALFLTFDDGGESAYTLTGPSLERRGWRGHFFITTDLIGQTGFLSAVQIRKLREAGHVIGTHSCSHPKRMARCPREVLDYEWHESVKRLEDVLGEPVIAGSVPGGYFSRGVAETAAAAGVKVLFTSEPVTSVRVVYGCAVIGRFSVQRGVSKETVGALAAGDATPRIRQWVFWNGKKLLKAAGGSLWLGVREKILARRDSGQAPSAGDGPRP